MLFVAKLEEQMAAEHLKLASTKVKELEKVIKDGYSVEKKRGKRKRSAGGAPGAKRPPSGYQIFVKENYKKDQDGDSKNAFKKVAEAWRSLGEEEKSIYNNRAKEGSSASAETGNNAVHADEVPEVPQSPAAQSFTVEPESTTEKKKKKKKKKKKSRRDSDVSRDSSY